jgi:predicted metal-dependent hydrolase
MQETLYIIIFVIVFYIVFILKDYNLVGFTINGNTVYVRDGEDKERSAQLLNDLTDNMFKLRDYLVNNIEMFTSNKNYIDLLRQNFTRSRTKIYETDFNSSYTSYAVNKGEELAFCIRCKPSGELHDMNLLMYVAVHEMAHTACPENGHTPLFNEIFRFMLQQAVKIKLYDYKDYSRHPVVYCGMRLYTNILN